MAEKPVVLKKGTRVEVCPYPTAYKVSYDDLQGLDGRCGIIETNPLPDDNTKASVILEGDLCARPLPIKALKPAKE